MCGSTVRVTAHHSIGLADGGTNDPATNGIPFCSKHHAQIEGKVRAKARGLADRIPRE